MPEPPSILGVSPHTVAPASTFLHYVQPNLNHGLRIWWAFYWPTTLAATLLTIAANLGLRQVYENTNAPGSVIGPLMKYDAYFFTYSVALLTMAYILRKRFRDFRIGLLSNQGCEGAQALRPTLWRTVRVWWTYSWRTLFYLALAWVVVILPLSWFVGLFNPRPLFVAVFFGIVGFILSGAIGLYAIYSNILDEDFGDFRVCLLPREVPAANPAVSVGS